LTQHLVTVLHNITQTMEVMEVTIPYIC